MRRHLAIAGFLVVTLAPLTATAGPECRCRLFGEKVAIGTVSCIKGKLMQCLMFQNTPSWKIVGDLCPMAKQNFTPRPIRGKPAAPPSAS
ncbi:MAG: hypothetical protein M3N38_12500 [Pseudomonadota bacterium]|nr:hypothetical protein [Pseudomonadota bacterium]